VIGFTGVLHRKEIADWQLNGEVPFLGQQSDVTAALSAHVPTTFMLANLSGVAPR
jgi:hypothetical protein